MACSGDPWWTHVDLQSLLKTDGPEVDRWRGTDDKRGPLGPILYAVLLPQHVVWPAQADYGGLVDSAGSMARLPASDTFAMRTSSLIATLNPITETTNPARLIQSPTRMVIGSSALIIDRGKAMFTLFLGATTF
jgi:hypothetical protein